MGEVYIKRRTSKIKNKLKVQLPGTTKECGHCNGADTQQWIASLCSQ